jgi:hypothetical protein
MPARSYALDIVWQFAAEEALKAGAPHIEPVHLLMGVCSVEKLFSADLSKLELTPYALASTRAEWEEVSAVFTRAQLCPSTLRRQLRQQLPPGSFPDSDPRTISRSTASRAAFAQAEQIATQAGSTLVGVIYLLHALLLQPEVSEVLWKFCPYLATLETTVALAAQRPLLAEPHIARKASTTAPVDRAEVKAMVKAAMGQVS